MCTLNSEACFQLRMRHSIEYEIKMKFNVLIAFYIDEQKCLINTVYNPNRSTYKVKNIERKRNVKGLALNAQIKKVSLLNILCNSYFFDFFLSQEHISTCFEKPINSIRILSIYSDN